MFGFTFLFPVVQAFGTVAGFPGLAELDAEPAMNPRACCKVRGSGLAGFNKRGISTLAELVTLTCLLAAEFLTLHLCGVARH